MTTQIAKWGNSLALRLPKSVTQEARIDEGDRVDISVESGTIVIRPSHHGYSLDALVSQITPDNCHDATDWGKPAGREAW